MFVRFSSSILACPLSISKTLDKILDENGLKLTLHSLLQHGQAICHLSLQFVDFKCPWGEWRGRPVQMERNIQRSFILEIPKRFKIQSKEGHYEFDEKLNIKYRSRDGENTWRTALPPGSEHSGKAPLYLRDEKTIHIHNHGQTLMYDVFHSLIYLFPPVSLNKISNKCTMNEAFCNKQ